MKKIYFFHFLKLLIIILLTYNIAVVSILYISSDNIRNFLWGWTPYNYKQILYFPNNLAEISFLEKSNRSLMISFLNKNIYKDYLDINFWDYKKIIESIDRENIKELEKSFLKEFILSKNNQKINIELRKYFIKYAL